MINLLDLVRRNRLSGLMNPIEMQNPTTSWDVNSGQGEQFQHPINPFDQNNDPNNPPILHHDMEGRFNEMLNNFPQRQPVGKWRQLGAIITGAGSDNPMQTADQFANYKYYNALKDYSARLPFFQRASENENNVNRQIMNEWVADRKMDETERYNRSKDAAAQSKLDETNRHALETEQQGRDKIEIARKAQSVSEWKARNPDYQFKTGRDGYIYAINPKNPSEQPISTGLQSAQVDDLTKHDWKLDEIEQRHQNTLGEIDARGNKAIEVKKVPSATSTTGAGANKPESETQRNQRLANNALIFQSTYPQWAHYVELDKAQHKFVRVVPDKNLDAQHSDEITKIIQGQLPMNYYQGGNKSSSVDTTRKYIPDANGVMVLNPNYKGGK